MNFTTDLPKKRPFVTYIVASAVKCEKFFPNSKNEGPSFRMHAVILNKSGMQTQKYQQAMQTPNNSKSLKYNKNNEDLKEDPFTSIVSTQCSSSIKSEDSDRNDLLLKNEYPGLLANNRRVSSQTIQAPEKNYILCHIRKIDSNYKLSKFNGNKRRPTADLEAEIDGVSKRKKRKSITKYQQPNLALKSNNQQSKVSQHYTRRKPQVNDRDEYQYRNNFSMFPPDPCSRISFESENSTSSTMFNNIGMHSSTHNPKINFNNFMSRELGSFGKMKDGTITYKPDETICKIDEVKDPKFEQIDQGSKEVPSKKIEPSRIESVITNDAKKFSNSSGFDYMKLFNFIATNINKQP